MRHRETLPGLGARFNGCALLDLLLPFPEEMLLELGWKEGDVIQWDINEDGSWTMRKKDGNQSV